MTIQRNISLKVQNSSQSSRCAYTKSAVCDASAEKSNVNSRVSLCAAQEKSRVNCKKNESFEVPPITPMQELNVEIIFESAQSPCKVISKVEYDFPKFLPIAKNRIPFRLDVNDDSTSTIGSRCTLLENKHYRSKYSSDLSRGDYILSMRRRERNNNVSMPQCSSNVNIPMDLFMPLLE